MAFFVYLDVFGTNSNASIAVLFFWNKFFACPIYLSFLNRPPTNVLIFHSVLQSLFHPFPQMQEKLCY